jgi:ATP:corrinoid adenosyltransferase
MQSINNGELSIDNAFKSVSKSVEKTSTDKEKQRVVDFINNAKTIDELENIDLIVVDEYNLMLEYDMKKTQLTK